MKKLVLAMAFLFVFLEIFAQSKNVQSAISYLRNKRLDKALDCINQAIVNENTMNDAKTWLYHGRIHLAIALSDKPEYKALVSNPEEISHQSLLKTIELDKDKEYFQDVLVSLMGVSEVFYNRGVEKFGLKQYDSAMFAFEKTIKINSTLGNKDTSATYNAALSAQNAQNWPKAKEFYSSLVKMNYSNPDIYATLSDIYRNEKDTVRMIKTIETGISRYPDNYSLIIAQANAYLFKGDADKAQKALQKAIEKEPNNPTIHFAVGTTYDRVGNFTEAEKAYKKAIELDPKMLDAIYNLGALYVNQAVVIMDAANKLPLNDPNYDKEKVKADEMLLKALPYLEKSHEMQPVDVAILNSLKDIYARTKKYDKLKEVNAKLQNLQQPKK